jgi:hypothetical protein
MDIAATLQTIVVAIGLSAACGLRIFIPPLVAALAARAGFLPLGADFEWLASTPAIAVLSVATLLEVGAYLIPWVDHALDVLATPAAIVAGFLLSAAVLGDIDPTLRWSLALVAGSGAAALVQIPSTLVRGASTLSSGGLANPVVSSAEAAGSTALSLLSVLAPILAVVFVAVLAAYLWSRRRSAHPNAIA